MRSFLGVAACGLLVPFIGIGASSLLESAPDRHLAENGLAYYTRENCVAKGYLPAWSSESYVPVTHFEKLFRSPLAIDLMAAAHSSNETGFEQVTADWGCDYKPCYGTGPTGTGCVSIGFFGPGAKDPAGGGCPRGPVKVYEDLTCAIRLGLSSFPGAFESFCGAGDEGDGMFECLAFFANVITETGAFAETEERDPRPYCWDRSPGNPNCCPAPDHQPCLPDSAHELSDAEFPQPHSRWLTDSSEPNKCCTYHGRGFLQVSYEPNYQALSESLVGDRTLLWHYPYLLRSDSVMGWTASLWFWFNSHAAQVGNAENQVIDSVSPRSEVLRWREGHGLPGAINVINGAECSGGMSVDRALNRVSYFLAIAHRLGAKPPRLSGDPDLPYYPLPGTAECESSSFCRLQFHNSNSRCPAFNANLDCVNSVTPYIVNASTPMGFWRKTIKMTAIDGATPLCQVRSSRSGTPEVWRIPQEGFTPIARWFDLLDIHRENVCDYVKLYYPFNEDYSNLVEGNSRFCQEVCWHDFAWDVSLRGTPCSDTPQAPCKAMAEYVSHPLPRLGWETGEMGDYKGGAFLGRVGPGMVMALNGQYGFGDTSDFLCHHFGASACHWNVAMGCAIDPQSSIHNCRIFPPLIPASQILATLGTEGQNSGGLAVGERPAKMREVLKYYDLSNCPTPTGRTVIEQIFPNGAMDFDYLFSVHYSQSDGYANARYDTSDVGVNVNSILYGSNGPRHVWKHMLCAFMLGVKSDPDYFQKKFGLRVPVASANQVPYPLNEEQRRFAQLEFIALAANMIKETGAMGQAEEQDPRCYCNYQGGAANPCCPNDWGNNPPCYTSTNSLQTTISAYEMERGTTPNARCCTYHGRGFLQTSYEWNYGELGAFMLKDDQNGVDEELGRKFLINYPQDIDPFGITGWVATFGFWLRPHPCQYCGGRDTSTLDWNAPEFSPHEAMVNYNVPGQGLGKTFNIINGQECEQDQTWESQISVVGAGMRLSLFYNLAWRMQVKAPGESTILPLPGTKECDASDWCRGTFYEDPNQRSYRAHAGGCWALTPQPSGTSEIWPWCRAATGIVGSTKFGASIRPLSFSMRTAASKCEMLHEFRCGARKIDPRNKPSMFSEPELKPYTEEKVVTTDYDNPEFLRLAGMSVEQLCNYITGTPLYNGQPCSFWCTTPAGAASCRAMDMETCAISASGMNFVHCANKFFKSLPQAANCAIVADDAEGGLDFTGNGDLNLGPGSGAGSGAGTGGSGSGSGSQAGTCTSCSSCVSTSGNSWDDAHCKNCANGANVQNWPCNISTFCKCAGGSSPAENGSGSSGNNNGGNVVQATTTTTTTTTTRTTAALPTPTTTTPSAGGVATVGCSTCSDCISTSGFSWDDDHCKKCALGGNTLNWPCNIATFCKCRGSPPLSNGSPGQVATTTSTARATTTSTARATAATSTTTTAAGGAGSGVGCDSCGNCVSTSGFSWDDDHCKNCAFGGIKNNWPCNIPTFCKCG